MIGLVNFIKFRSGLVFLLALALHANQAFAQEIKANAEFDSTQILIGDQIKFRISIDQPIDAVFKIPAFTDKLADKIEVLKVFMPDTVKQGNQLKVTYEYLVTSFDSGVYKLPAINIPFAVGIVKDTIRVTPAVLTVLPMVTDTITQVKDIKAPLNTPLNFAELWPYIAGFLLLIVIVVVAIYFAKRRKDGSVPLLVNRRNDPPHVLALQELDRLRAEKLWQNNMVKQYYVRLSETVRVYIERRFGIEALEMTTEEIVFSLRNTIVEEPGSVEVLKSLLTLADLVKFAKASPLPNENEVSLLNAYQFVNNTKPVTVIPPPTEASDAAKEDDNQQVFN
jgi:hypothetical protein